MWAGHVLFKGQLPLHDWSHLGIHRKGGAVVEGEGLLRPWLHHEAEQFQAVAPLSAAGITPKGPHLQACDRTGLAHRSLGQDRDAEVLLEGAAQLGKLGAPAGNPVELSLDQLLAQDDLIAQKQHVLLKAGVLQPVEPGEESAVVLGTGGLIVEGCLQSRCGLESPQGPAEIFQMQGKAEDLPFAAGLGEGLEAWWGLGSLRLS